MKKTLNSILALGLIASLTGSAFAQTPAPQAPAAPSAPAIPAKPATPTIKPATTAPAAKATDAKAERSAKSLDCSKQADTKGLHGKERKKFRDECKKG